MVVQCSAFGCENRSGPESKKENIFFSKFPLHDPFRLEQWAISVNRCAGGAKQFEPNQYSNLCSVHFSDIYIEKIGIIARLKHNASPTVFHNKSESPDPSPSPSKAREIKKTSISWKKGTPSSRSYDAKSIKSPFRKTMKMKGHLNSTPSSKKSGKYVSSKKMSPIKSIPSSFNLSKSPLKSKLSVFKSVRHPAVSKELLVFVKSEKKFCCVPHCYSGNTKVDTTYITLPTDPERYEEWITLMDRLDLLKAEGTRMAKNLVICPSHFSDEMWVKSKTRNMKLVKHAVPSIFPDVYEKTPYQRMTTKHKVGPVSSKWKSSGDMIRSVIDADDIFQSPSSKKPGPASKTLKHGLKRKVRSPSPSPPPEEVDEPFETSDEDWSPDEIETPTKKVVAVKKTTAPKMSPAPKKRKTASVICSICGREFPRWFSLKRHMVAVHKYKVSSQGELTASSNMKGTSDDDDDDDGDDESSNESEIAANAFLQVNMVEGDVAVSQGDGDGDDGFESLLRLKTDECEELRKDIINYRRVLKENGIDQKEMMQQFNMLSDSFKKKKSLMQGENEPKYTEEQKRLWENLVTTEIKKSKKFMDGLEKAQKLLNNQIKENTNMKHKIKTLEDSSSTPANSSYAMKKKLNDEIQKNRKLQERVKQLQDDLKSRQKTVGDLISTDKINALMTKLKKSEDNLKVSQTSLTEQQRKFKWKYADQTKHYQKKIRSVATKCSRLEKKNKMLQLKVNNQKDVGTMAQLLRDSSKFLTRQQSAFFEGQMKATGSSTEKFWNRSFQELMLTLYQTSPKAYKVFQKFFALPSVKTINDWMQSFELSTRDTNAALMTALNEEARSISEFENKYVEKKDSTDADDMPVKNEKTVGTIEFEPGPTEDELPAVDGEKDVLTEENEEMQVNGVENEMDIGNEELLEEEEEEEGRADNENDNDDQSTEDDGMGESDEEDDGMIKSDDDIDNPEAFEDSDWSDTSATDQRKSSKIKANKNIL